MSRLSVFKKLLALPLSFAVACAVAVLPALEAHGQSSVRIKKKKAAPKQETPDILVPVPQSVLNFASAPEPEAPKPSPHWEIAASSWAPRALSESAYLNDVSNFQRLKMPMLTFNFWRSDGNSLGVFKWGPKYGVSYNQLARQATMRLSGVDLPVSQTMNVFSARLGLEITLQKDWLGLVRPFFNVSGLPSFAVTASSEISEGGSRGFLAVEEVAGVSLQAPAVASVFGIKDIGLEIGLQATQGAGESSLSGVGVLAGTRIDL